VTGQDSGEGYSLDSRRQLSASQSMAGGGKGADGRPVSGLEVGIGEILGGGATNEAETGIGAWGGARKRSRTLFEPHFAAVAAAATTALHWTAAASSSTPSQTAAVAAMAMATAISSDRAGTGAGITSGVTKLDGVLDTGQPDVAREECTGACAIGKESEENDGGCTMDKQSEKNEGGVTPENITPAVAAAHHPNLTVKTKTKPNFADAFAQAAASTREPSSTRTRPVEVGGMASHWTPDYNSAHPGQPSPSTGGAGAGGDYSSQALRNPPKTVFLHRTVFIAFNDADLPGALRARVQSRQRLLRLYESGLPPWALFLASYGFFYRPYLRFIARLMFALVSGLSMMAGFYDLYKHIPGANAILASVWAPFIEFLEQHTSIRLSILASYLFTQSTVFAPLMAQLSVGAQLTRSAAAAVWSPVAALFGGVWRDAAAVLRLSLGAAGLAARTSWGVAAVVLRPGLHVLAAVVTPFADCAPVLRDAFGPVVEALVRAFGMGNTTFKVSASTGAWGGLGFGAGLGLSWLDFQIWRDFGVTVFRAVQRIVTFLAYVCAKVNTHRLSLGIATRRRWRQVVARWSPVQVIGGGTGGGFGSGGGSGEGHEQGSGRDGSWGGGGGGSSGGARGSPDDESVSGNDDSGGGDDEEDDVRELDDDERDSNSFSDKKVQ